MHAPGKMQAINSVTPDTLSHGMEPTMQPDIQTLYHHVKQRSQQIKTSVQVKLAEACVQMCA